MEIPEVPEAIRKLALEAAEQKQPVKWIEVHQEKSKFFRVVHGDGVWCSVNPWNQICMSFYSERLPLPTNVFFPVTKDGTVLDEDVSKRQMKMDWFREIEVSVSVSLEVAERVHQSLGNSIAFAKEQKQKAKG